MGAPPSNKKPVVEPQRHSKNSPRERSNWQCAGKFNKGGKNPGLHRRHHQGQTPSINGQTPVPPPPRTHRGAAAARTLGKDPCRKTLTGRQSWVTEKEIALRRSQQELGSCPGTNNRTYTKQNTRSNTKWTTTETPPTTSHGMEAPPVALTGLGGWRTLISSHGTAALAGCREVAETRNA